MPITINGTTGIAGVDGSASAPALQGSDSNTGVFFGTDTVTVATGGTAAVTVDSGQRTKFPTTIGVGNATPSTSGSGISFPATQSASSDANTLDDYEEGTWNPTLTPGSGTITLKTTSDTLSYTKIGRVVTISGMVIVNSSSGSGSLTIGNFPFTFASLTEDAGNFGSVIAFQDASAGYPLSQILVSADKTYTYINTSQIADSIQANDQYRFSFSYFTS